MSIVTGAGFFISLLAGILVSRYGVQRIGVFGLIVGSLGGIVSATASSFFWLVTGRLLLGIGSALGGIAGLTLVSAGFPNEKAGSVLGIAGTGIPLATILALNVLPLTGLGGSWRITLAASAVPMIILTALFLTFFKDQYSKDQVNFNPISAFNSQLWLLGFVHGLASVAFHAYLAWAGTFFIELKAATAGYAFFMVSILMVATIFLSPVIGIFSDKHGKRKTLIITALLLRVIAFALIPFLTLQLLLLSVILLCLSSYAGSQVFTVASTSLPKGSSGVGFGVIITCEAVGGFLGPLLVGYLRDVRPIGDLSFYAMAIFSSAAALAMTQFRSQN